MTTLEKLIERLEKATEGSLDLDEAILRLIRPELGGEYVRTNDYDYGFCLHRAATIDYVTIPKFTASLDAAMSLVPEGWKVSLSTERNASFAKFAAHAYIMDRDWPDPVAGQGIAQDGHAASLPLALCLAALKALNSRQSKD